MSDLPQQGGVPDVEASVEGAQAADSPSLDTSLRGALTGQRRVVQAGLLFMLAAVVIGLGVGEPAVGGLVAFGILLAIVNALATEHSLARMLASGEDFSQKQFALSAMMRLGAISLVAFGLVVLIWPNGVAVLVGLAAFNLITLILQGVPLLKELHKV